MNTSNYKAIHKFILQDTVDNGACFAEIRSHIGFKVAHIGIQRNSLCMWVIVDDSLPKASHVVVVAPTGSGLDSLLNEAESISSQNTAKYSMFQREHVGTVVNPSSSNVWHVFV